MVRQHNNSTRQRQAVNAQSQHDITGHPVTAAQQKTAHALRYKQCSKRRRETLSKCAWVYKRRRLGRGKCPAEVALLCSYYVVMLWMCCRLYETQNPLLGYGVSLRRNRRKPHTVKTRTGRARLPNGRNFDQLE